jgi:DNA invertase Pin-like site-specific DNA recombinase
VDDAVSGRLFSRPAFDRLRSAVEGGEVHEVYVCKIDRLGRSAKGILEFFDFCEAHDVRVVVTDQGIDTATPIRRFFRTVAAAFAELEADLARERTRDAMVAFKAGTRKTRSGKPVGRPRVLTDELLRRIHELRDTPRDDGKRRTWGQIARMVHHPAGSLKKWYAASRSDFPRVINPVR